NRSSADDSEGQSEMGGERGCNRAGHFHCRAVWYRRITPKSIKQNPIAVGACSTEFRNETGSCVIGGGRKTISRFFFDPPFASQLLFSWPPVVPADVEFPAIYLLLGTFLLLVAEITEDHVHTSQPIRAYACRLILSRPSAGET